MLCPDDAGIRADGEPRCHMFVRLKFASAISKSQPAIEHPIGAC
jgi:hypothetical protein